MKISNSAKRTYVGMCVLIKNEAIDVDEYYTTANNGVALTAPLMARNQKLLDCHCYLYSSKKNCATSRSKWSRTIPTVFR